MNIYALFLRLGFNNQENLTFKDQITLKKIESYFDLKVRKTNNLMLLFIYDYYCDKLNGKTLVVESRIHVLSLLKTLQPDLLAP